MQGPWSLLATSFAIFVATNVDDIVLLAAFFADRRMRPSAVVAGQFAGMAILIAASAAVALAAWVIAPGWLALMGVVPLGMGLWQLVGLLRGRSADDDDAADIGRRAESGSMAQIIGVALVTLANGADNLGAYIPLFASQLTAVPLIALVFMVLTGVWCYLAHVLVRTPALSPMLQRYGHVLLPIVLIAVGLQILWGAREHFFAGGFLP